MKLAGLYIMAFAIGFASDARAASSERESSRPLQEAPRGIQLAKGSPASKAFGNPFKTPSDMPIDFEPTGSISTGGKTQPSTGGKTDASPSLGAPPAQKGN